MAAGSFPDPGYQYGKFYKYRGFSGQDSEERTWLRDLIVDRKMMFSSPSAFNDPYDCRPSFIRGTKPSDDRKAIQDAWLEGAAKKGWKRPKKSVLDKHVSEVMQELATPQGGQRHFKEILDDGTGVFCMSRRWDIMTQWAYYGDHGRGLCIEYDVTKDSGFDRVFRVAYADQRPTLNIAKTLVDAAYRSEAMFSAVTTKASCWSHEQEYRAMHNEPGIHEHPEDLMNAIILGPNVLTTDRRWLEGVLKESEISVPIYEASLNPVDFSLDRE